MEEKKPEPSAEYTKLPDGSWAVWVTHMDPQDGDILQVTSWDGSVTDETIKHVLWRDERGAICTIVPWKRADGALRGRCHFCYSLRLWASYPRYERQSIVVDVIDGVATYEYSGETIERTGSDPRPGEQFLCAGCGRTAPSVEQLVGLSDDGWYGGQGLQGDYYAMESIHTLLDGRTWSMATLDHIAAILRATGRPVWDDAETA